MNRSIKYRVTAWSYNVGRKLKLLWQLNDVEIVAAGLFGVGYLLWNLV